MKERQLEDAVETLACSIDKFACSIDKLVDELRNQNGQQAILNRLAQMETKIMSAISDHTDAVNKAFDAIDTAVEGLTKSQTGIADDVTYLKEVIDKLQTTPGPISAEDQKLLDAAQARANGAVVKVAASKEALEALDAATERPPEIQPA